MKYCCSLLALFTITMYITHTMEPINPSDQLLLKAQTSTLTSEEIENLHNQGAQLNNPCLVQTLITQHKNNNVAGMEAMLYYLASRSQDVLFKRYTEALEREVSPQENNRVGSDFSARLSKKVRT